MADQDIRQEIITTVRRAEAAGLVRLSAGNISARTPDGRVMITPRGIQYSVLAAGQIAGVDLDGRLLEGPHPPSSETPMHTAIYRSLPQVGAICHTHSPFALVFAMLGEAVPPGNLELWACGAPVPVCRWACPGSEQAGQVVVEALRRQPGLKVCLLRNHGLVAVGRDLEQAFEMAYNAEVGLQAAFHARQLGQPLEISPAQLAEIEQVYGRGWNPSVQD
jgi:L-ribulose-5-phosphate 4-epimerase